jgi:hypothetical protein
VGNEGDPHIAFEAPSVQEQYLCYHIAQGLSVSLVPRHITGGDACLPVYEVGRETLCVVGEGCIISQLHVGY